MLVCIFINSDLGFSLCVCRHDYAKVLYTPHTDTAVAFFTHNSPLSNMYPCMFVVAKTKYVCSEQFITVQKALLFHDHDTARKLMSQTIGASMKKIAKHVKGLNQSIWHKKAYHLIMPGILAKFSQNEECKKILLGTGDRMILEASRNCIWGVGHALDSVALWDPCLRRGENLMGHILMEVRSIIAKK